MGLKHIFNVCIEMSTYLQCWRKNILPWNPLTPIHQHWCVKDNWNENRQDCKQYLKLKHTILISELHKTTTTMFFFSLVFESSKLTHFHYFICCFHRCYKHKMFRPIHYPTIVRWIMQHPLFYSCVFSYLNLVHSSCLSYEKYKFYD